jgi:hypothetical protein
MYSEGMAIPKDMPGIVAGRVHNALYYPPMLNLNKFIKPEFAIFRVAEQFKEQREAVMCLLIVPAYTITEISNISLFVILFPLCILLIVFVHDTFSIPF